MPTRKLMLATLLLSAAASIAPGVSLAAVNIDIDVAPPPARVEVVPGPREGYVWAPGYWAWRGHEHVWVGGHWSARPHPGAVWMHAHWSSHGHHHVWVSGYWR